MNSVQLLSLDSADTSMYTLIQGDMYYSSFVALTQDTLTGDIYFTDVNK